jgi:hypothetical protein
MKQIKRERRKERRQTMKMTTDPREVHSSTADQKAISECVLKRDQGWLSVQLSGMRGEKNVDQSHIIREDKMT